MPANHRSQHCSRASTLLRKDRPRQLVAALSQPDFTGFDRGGTSLAAVSCMMSYDRSQHLPYAFAPE